MTGTVWPGTAGWLCRRTTKTRAGRPMYVAYVERLKVATKWKAVWTARSELRCTKPAHSAESSGSKDQLSIRFSYANASSFSWPRLLMGCTNFSGCFPDGRLHSLVFSCIYFHSLAFDLLVIQFISMSIFIWRSHYLEFSNFLTFYSSFEFYWSRTSGWLKLRWDSLGFTAIYRLLKILTLVASDLLIRSRDLDYVVIITQLEANQKTFWPITLHIVLEVGSSTEHREQLEKNSDSEKASQNFQSESKQKLIQQLQSARFENLKCKVA